MRAGTMVAKSAKPLKTCEKFVPLTTSELSEKEDERIAKMHKREEEERIRLHVMRKEFYMKCKRPTDLLGGILYDMEYLHHKLPRERTYFFDQTTQNSQNHQNYYE